MIRTRLLPASAALAVLWACKALFYIHIEGSDTSTVPAATPVEIILDDLGFGDFVEMDITEASELQNQGVEPGDITTVTLELLTLEATSPAGSDLSFIDRIDLYVEAPDQQRSRIAWQDDFPVGQALVELNLDEIDIVNHALSQSMTITADVAASRPEDETEIEVVYDIRVGVTGQGCKSAL